MEFLRDDVEARKPFDEPRVSEESLLGSNSNAGFQLDVGLEPWPTVSVGAKSG